VFNNHKKHIIIAAAAVICFAAIITDLISSIFGGFALHIALACIETLAFISFAAMQTAAAGHGFSQPPAAGNAGSPPELQPGRNDAGDKFKNLISIIENIESNQPFKDILKYIYDSFSPYIPYSHIGVALIDDDMVTIRSAYIISGTQHPNLARRLTGFKTDIRSTSLMRVLQSGEPRVINDLEAYCRGREPREYNRILLE